MKKIIPVIMCVLCLLAAAPVYANDKEDVTAAINAYFAACKKGDVIGSLEYLSREYRVKMEGFMTETPSMTEFFSQILKMSEYELIRVELKDGQYYAEVPYTMPDLEYIIGQAADGLDDKTMSEEEFVKEMTKKAIELMQEENFMTLANVLTFMMIKEDGAWKINDMY